MPGEPPRRRSGRSHEAPGDGRPRGMAITISGPRHPGAGQNPAYTPSGAFAAVDALADRVGISAVSGGQPCGSANWPLHGEPDRVGSQRCGRYAVCRGRGPGIGVKRGYARRRTTLKGEGAGDPIGSPVPFSDGLALSKGRRDIGLGTAISGDAVATTTR